jgi:hypothetical protein
MRLDDRHGLFPVVGDEDFEAMGREQLSVIADELQVVIDDEEFAKLERGTARSNQIVDSIPA